MGRQIRRPRSVSVQPLANSAEPLLEQAVAESTSQATPIATRGEFTMGLITGSYATSLGASYTILDSAFGLQGWHAALMMNTVLLGYLFFFNGWWRLTPVNRRIRQC